ncbi:uncharacterized protein Tco025E_02125, partial [Trypanosoma conorhini]
RAELRKERDDAAAERDELRKERDDAAAERDELRKELDGAAAERDELRKEPVYDRSVEGGALISSRLDDDGVSSRVLYGSLDVFRSTSSLLRWEQQFCAGAVLDSGSSYEGSEPLIVDRVDEVPERASSAPSSRDAVLSELRVVDDFYEPERQHEVSDNSRLMAVEPTVGLCRRCNGAAREGYTVSSLPYRGRLPLVGSGATLGSFRD